MSINFKPKPFGEYYLLERIAVGGMAEIFKAKTFGVGGFEKLLAIKRILPHHAQNEEFITMLIDEAKIAVALNHVNIVQVFDLGKIENDYFIAMEYVEGRDLRTLMRKCRQLNIPLSVENAVYIILEICKGLDYAHRKTDKAGKSLGVVHRDISPQNLLISFEGEVKIVDFGIAQAANKVTETESGILKGKFSYMSPEQAAGFGVDQRTDIFSTGIILYELLTGEKLFKGDSHLEILDRIKKFQIEPPFLPSDIPSELEFILTHALSPDRDERYTYASDFQIELTKFLYSSNTDFTARNVSDLMRQLFHKEMNDERGREKVDFEIDEATRSSMLRSHSELIVSKIDHSYDPNPETEAGSEKDTRNRTIIQKFQEALRRSRKAPVSFNPRPPDAHTDKIPMLADFPSPKNARKAAAPVSLPPPLPKTSSVALLDEQTDRMPVPLPKPVVTRPQKAATFPYPIDLGRSLLGVWNELSNSRKVALLIGLVSTVLFLVMLAAYLSKTTPQPTVEAEITPPPIATPSLPPTNAQATAIESGLPPPKNLQTVNFNPNVIPPQSGRIVIQSNPQAARVSVNNRTLGVTPVEIYNVPAGEDVPFKIQAINHAETTLYVSLSPHEKRSLQVTLEPLWGKIEINTTPPKAQVIVNKIYLGLTPFRYDKIKPAEDTLLEVKKDGFEPYRVTFRVGPEEGRVFNKVLEKSENILAVSSQPQGAVVYLNGQNRGMTPLEMTDLSLDRYYLVIVRAQGYRDWAQFASLRAGKSVRLSATLLPQNSRFGVLVIESRPSGATLELDGKTLRQQTPAVLDQLRTDRSYNLKISLSGYEPLETLVTVQADEITTRSITLSKPQTSP